MDTTPHFHGDGNNGAKSYTGLKSSDLHLPNSFFDTMNYRSKLTFGPPPHFCNDTNNSIKNCAGILWIVIMQTKLALKYRAFTGQNDYDLIKFIYLISKSEWMQNGWEQHKLQEKVRDVIISPNNSFAFELW